MKTFDYDQVYKKENDSLEDDNFLINSNIYSVNKSARVNNVPLNRRNINTNIYSNRIELELKGYFMIANIKISDNNYKKIIIKSDNFKLYGKKKNNIWTFPHIDNDEFLILHINNFPLYLVIYTNYISFNNLNITYDILLLTLKEIFEYSEKLIQKKYYISYNQKLYLTPLSRFERFKDYCYFYYSE